MGWFEDVTGQGGWDKEAYRDNKAAMGGATINQGNLDKAASAGLLGKNSSGETVRNSGSVVLDGNNNIVVAYGGTGPGNPGAYKPPTFGGTPTVRTATEAGSWSVGGAYVPRPTGSGGTGPGNITVNDPAGTGTGRTVVTTGKPGKNQDWFAGSPGKIKPDGSIDLGYDEVLPTTAVVIGGNEAPRDQGWSDGEIFTQRTGEGDFLTPAWFYSWAVFGADLWSGIKPELQGMVEHQVDTAKDWYNEVQPPDDYDWLDDRVDWGAPHTMEWLEQTVIPK